MLIKLLPPPMTNANLANDDGDQDAEEPLISAESSSLQPSDVQLHTDEDAMVWPLSACKALYAACFACSAISVDTVAEQTCRMPYLNNANIACVQGCVSCCF